MAMQQTWRVLNEIMAVALLDGNPTFAFREFETGSTTIDPETKHIRMKVASALSVKAPLISEQFRPNSPGFLGRKVIPTEQLRRWVSAAEKIAQDQDLSESVVFLLESYTHLLNSEYLESFVLSWVIVEKHLYKVWEHFLKDEKLHRDRREKLANPVVWSADSVIETLNLVGQLSLDEYAGLMRLKKLRNDIIHVGERVSKKEADEALEVSLRIVKKQADV